MTISDFRDINFEIIDPTVDPKQDSHPQRVLRDCYYLGRAAFGEEFGLDQVAAAEFMGGSPLAFANDHRKPQQRLVERGRLNPQDLSRPCLVVAYDSNGKEHPAGNVVGYAYGTDTVTGDTEEKRRLKERTLVKRWRWGKEVATDPNYRGRGVAKATLSLLYGEAWLLQPASGYTYPELSTAGVGLLISGGMHDDGGRQPVKLPGIKEEVMMHRHSARSARAVSRRYAEQINVEALRARTRRHPLPQTQ